MKSVRIKLGQTFPFEEDLGMWPVRLVKEMKDDG